MWFWGALVGAVLGAAASEFEGFLIGALLGAMAGRIISLGNAVKERIGALERKVAALEAAIVLPAPAPKAPPAPEPVSRPEPVIVKVPVVEAQARYSNPVPEVKAPSGPSLWERLIGGNLVAKVGVLILFIGVAFLVKYFYERVHVPIELRLTGVALGALAVLVIGWRLRASRPGYALILQGGAIGVLYLLIFASFRLFNVLPGGLAFALLVAMAAASAVLAIAQNSLTLAVIGAAGGFVAPVLASTGRGSHVMLFSYYAVLNAGIFAVAWVKAWRVLNVVGFAFTFGIGTLWGARSYRPELFASTEPFLLLFFALYLAIPVLYARRRAVELKDYVDGTLVFGTPVVAFGLQAAAVRHIEYAAAYSALFFSAVYLALALALFRRTGQGLRLLVESHIALSVAFATLAIPLAFDGRLTSATWALEAAAIIWIGVRQQRMLARVFGYLLQIAAGIAFLVDVDQGYGATPVANSFAMGCLFIALAGFFCSAYLERNRERVREAQAFPLAAVLLGWAALWWYAGGLHEIGRHVADAYRSQAGLMFFTASAVLASLLARAFRWHALRWLCLLLYPAMAVQVAFGWQHPFAHLGASAWIFAFAAHLWLLQREASEEQQALFDALRALGVWLLALVAAREVGWQIDALVEGKRVWPSISWAIVPGAILFALASRRLRARWPISTSADAYVVQGGAPLAVFLAVWVVYANIASDGDPYPLPYVPLLNPLDIAIAAVFLVLARWLAVLPEHGLAQWWAASRTPALIGFGAVAFLWVNAILVRTLHHWAGVAFAAGPMFASPLAQAAFSILWTLLALGAMVAATRRALRALWVSGAGLMGVVVAKLFLVDLSGIGTLERIVSFIVVGLLMLLVGYLSPVPPKEARAA
jgi:uncharacterized membrane protein